MRKHFVLWVCLLALGVGRVEAQQAPVLDTTSFVVMGEGLAAGLADFALREVYQEKSFPAVMARQMETAFPQPFIQAPGIGGVPGFPQLPTTAPNVFQTTVRLPFPPSLFVFNLAVPGHRLTDAINLRPRSPLVQSSNPKQTITNMILGFPALILGPDKPLWTQLEYAMMMNPTLVLVELGYTEALEAAVSGNPDLIPEPAAFRADYARVLAGAQSNFAQVIATTVPDPFDTAYFSSLASAAQVTGASTGTLASRYGLRQDDLLTPNALSAIGVQATTLPEGSVMSAAAAAPVRAKIRALNSEITSVSQQAGAVLYDLNGLFARIRASGLTVGSRRLTADYLGGFYSLSGSFPGVTGHALIANEILQLLNQKFGTSFPLVNLAEVVSDDPAVRFKPATADGETEETGETE